MKLWRDRNQQRYAAERILRRAFRVAPAVMGICLSAAALADEPTRARPRRTPPVETRPVPSVETSQFNDETRRFNDYQPEFLRSGGSTLYANRATEAFEQARRLYFKGAFASAEGSAWEALNATAMEVSLRDSSHPYGDPVEALRVARIAMTEARDFGGRFDVQDTDAIKRMVRSHRTDTLKNAPIENLSIVDASDAYLDDARERLAVLSTQSVMAARAMDLLAAILLSRNEASVLPSSTAICLRRAALQGQPGNPSLARRLAEHLDDVGLRNEAKLVFAHADNVSPNANSPHRSPLTIETVSPAAFAAMSPPVNSSSSAPKTTPLQFNRTPSVPVQSVSYRTVHANSSPATSSPSKVPARPAPQVVESTPVEVRKSFLSRITPSFLRSGDR